jgi:flagellar motor switch protein FliM
MSVFLEGEEQALLTVVNACVVLSPITVEDIANMHNGDVLLMKQSFLDDAKNFKARGGKYKTKHNWRGYTVYQTEVDSKDED